MSTEDVSKVTQEKMKTLRVGDTVSVIELLPFFANTHVMGQICKDIYMGTVLKKTRVRGTLTVQITPNKTLVFTSPFVREGGREYFLCLDPEELRKHQAQLELGWRLSELERIYNDLKRLFRRDVSEYQNPEFRARFLKLLDMMRVGIEKLDDGLQND